MEALSAAQQALAQAQLALSRIVPSTAHESISANASVNGDEGECPGCSKLEDQLSMERGRARERERRLLKEVKGLRDELSALGWTGSVPVALMDGDEEEEEHVPVVAQRRSLRHDMAPPPAKRLRIDEPPSAPVIRATTIRATAAGSSSVSSKSKSKSKSKSSSSASKSKAKPPPPPPAPRLSLTPSNSAPASVSGSTRPRAPPTAKPGSLRLAAHDLPPNWIRRIPPDPNVVASAAAAMSLRLRGGRGRLQMAWGDKLPALLLDGGMYEYELPWWVMGDEGVDDDDDDEQEEEDAEDEQDEEEDEPEPEMTAQEREKAEKRQAKSAAQRIRRAAQRERLAAERKKLEGARAVESDEQEDELEPEPEAPKMSAAERDKEEKRQASLAERREVQRAKRAAEREKLEQRREVRRIKDREAREAKKAKEEAAAAAGELEDEDEGMEMENVSTGSPLTPSSLSASLEPAMDLVEGSPVGFMAWAPQV
ncbi:hypothetical protein FB45DRAFT_921022 [Roridomyces roridus]|uniref:Uncharacterized protein n=1 Tax=Roridomyces roridus TaxID=1738132 RepID=A0AAD7BQH0_9AGAR|nr:hypothetical protein FB45DRAFT_921022 [Roridomyces roridus]